MNILPLILSIISAISFGTAIYFIFMNTNQFNIRIKHNKTIIISLILLGISLVILGFTIDYIIEIYKEPQGFDKDFSKIGTYGDFFGGILNPILAFIGILAASLAFYAQYEANRQVQIQFEEQKKGDYVQNFESNFYNLLSIHHQIVQDIDYKFSSMFIIQDSNYEYYFNDNKSYFSSPSDESIIKSRDVFKHSFLLLEKLLKQEIFILSNNEIDVFNVNDQPFIKNVLILQQSIYMNYTNIINTRFNSIYNIIYKKYDSDFGHYFRNLYRLIKIVDEKKFSENIIEDYKIKYSYTSIIRAQLSDAEIKWLFLNCLSDKGYKKFKPLVEKYSLVKIINLNDEVFGYFSKFYLDSAFNNPSTDELIKKHLEINFYNNDVFKPKFGYIKVKKLD
jgi:hypothetical protein